MYQGTARDSTKSNNQNINNQEEPSYEDDDIHWYYGLTPFIILGACAVYTSTITLIPYHDVFEFPSFWWENLFISGILYAALQVSLSQMREIYLVFKLDSILSISYYLKLFLGTALGFIVPYCGFYVYWTVMQEQNHPLPMVDMLCHFFFQMPCLYSMI